LLGFDEWCGGLREFWLFGCFRCVFLVFSVFLSVFRVFWRILMFGGLLVVLCVFGISEVFVLV